MISSSVEQKQVTLISMLQDWADWQRGYSLKGGYPRRSTGMDCGGSSQTFDDMCDALDSRICRAVDSAVDDLLPHHRAAVCHRYLASVFQFRRLVYIDVLSEAHDLLLAGLTRKGIIF